MVDYMIGGAGTVRITGGQATCPMCGEMAQIPDGEYSFDDDKRPGWTYFKPITPAQAARVKTVAEWARAELDRGAEDGRIKERIDDVLEKNAPGWKKVIDALLSTRAVNLYQLLGFILMLLVFFGLDPAHQQKEGPPKISVDQLGQLLDEYLEKEEAGSDRPTPPDPELGEPGPIPQPTQEE